MSRHGEARQQGGRAYPGRQPAAPHLVALVRAGARFERGVLDEREQAQAA
jgi:hypothetical protein